LTLALRDVMVGGMAINWFPGHMHKTRQTLAAMMPKCDVVIELLDARLPLSSSNPLLDELRRGIPGKGVDGLPGDVPCITLLNKADLADPAMTRVWRQHMEATRGVKSMAFCASKPGEVKKLPNLIRRLAPKRVERNQKVRVMVVGVPNCGKSTLINAMRGKRVANVGDEPAVTRGRQEVDLKNGILLIDTPGILWPKFDDQRVGYLLAMTGAIKDTALDYADIGAFAAGLLSQHCPDQIKTRYKLDAIPDEPIELLEAIGKKRGCLVGGGEVNLDRASELLLREMRSGKLGPMTLERPEDQVAEPDEAGNAETA